MIVLGTILRTTQLKFHVQFQPIKEVQQDKKIILLWTTRYGVNDGFGLGYGPEKFSSCPVSNCQLSSGRTLFNESSAVMFHMRYEDWKDTVKPEYRFPHQRFISFNLDYQSPKQLVDRLRELSENRKLYAQYMDWRRHFEFEDKAHLESWCTLCQMLNDRSLPTKSYANIAKWWFDDYPCEKARHR